MGRVRASVPTFFWWYSPSLVLGFAWRLWPFGGPGTCYFLGPYLGFFPLASSVGWWLEVVEVYPWLSSLRSFAVEVVTLVLCQVLVGLPSWRCCASGLLGPVVFLVFMLGHLSQVWSVFFLSPRSWCCFPSFGWVCFWSSCGFTTSGWRCGLRLALVRTAVLPSHGSVLILQPGFLFSGLVERGAFHRVHSPLSSFGMWSPFGVISVFCHYWSPTKVSIGGVFFCVVSSHLGVVS